MAPVEAVSASCPSHGYHRWDRQAPVCAACEVYHRVWPTPAGQLGVASSVQVGRLQTQQILSSAASAREIEISVISLPHQAHLERPFDVVIRLVSQVEHRVGPLLIHIAGKGQWQASCAEQMDLFRACPDHNIALHCLQGVETPATMPAWCSLGAQCLHVDEVLPLKAVELPMRFLPLEAGVQAVGSGMVVTDELEGKVYDTLQAPNIYVCR